MFEKDVEVRRLTRKLLFLVILLAGAFLTGCLVPFNLVVEGPGGEWALVLGAGGTYDPLPRGGALWLISPEGEPVRELLPLGERESAGDLCWSQSGDELLAVVVEMSEGFPFPEGWRLVQLPTQGDPRVLLDVDFPIYSPTYSQTESQVLYVAAPVERPELHRLDITTGQDQLLMADILTYIPADEGLLLFSTEGVASLDDSEIARFQCPEEDCQLFLTIWPDLFLDLAPDGRSLALTVADRPGLESPQTEATTSLYLVDLGEGSARRLATPALSPSFSPDSQMIAFVGETPDDRRHVYVYAMESDEVRELPGLDQALWVRWGRGGIVAAEESEDGGYELLSWDGTGWRPLLSWPVGG